MIGPEHEQPKTGAGDDFVDVVALDFCDPGSGLCGLVWMTNLPNAGVARANALLFAKGTRIEQLELSGQEPIDWRAAAVDGVRMSVTEPLEGWSVEVSGGDASLQLDARALSGPRELGKELSAETIGVEQYEQLTRVSGTLESGGRPQSIRCLGRRVHAWGEFDWGSIDRWRTLYAVSEAGRAISVAAALPAGSAGHESELKVARFLDAEEEQAFEDVRVSTVFGSDGLPAKAGVELWMPGDELPRRLGGEAICGARSVRNGRDLSVTFFRWSMEGVPAFGCYELESRT